MGGGGLGGGGWRSKKKRDRFQPRHSSWWRELSTFIASEPVEAKTEELVPVHARRKGEKAAPRSSRLVKGRMGHPGKEGKKGRCLGLFIVQREKPGWAAGCYFADKRMNTAGKGKKGLFCLMGCGGGREGNGTVPSTVLYLKDIHAPI